MRGMTGCAVKWQSGSVKISGMEAEEISGIPRQCDRYSRARNVLAYKDPFGEKEEGEFGYGRTKRVDFKIR